MDLPRWGKISPGIEIQRWSETRGLGNMADTQSDAEIIIEEDLGVLGYQEMHVMRVARISIKHYIPQT